VAERHYSGAMGARSTPSSGKGLRTTTLLFAYPALRQLPRSDWDGALQRARETDFDVFEWAGMLAGITFVTYLLRFEADQAAALALPARYVIQFLAAVPLLALVVGPFYLRRTRRGLDQDIERQIPPTQGDVDNHARFRQHSRR
jgi:hypothetical protein